MTCRILTLPIVFSVVFLLSTAPATAGVTSQMVRETAEIVMKRFGKEAAKEGAESITRRLGLLAARHGDEALLAVRKVGPRGLKILEEAGEHAPQAARVMAKHGERGAIAVASKPSVLKLVAKHGEEAAEACVRHMGVAEPFIEKFGAGGAKALANVGTQGGRRLAMMAESGELAAIGRSEELLAVVVRFGDAAMKWVWDNKKSLAVATVLTAFLTNPEPFIHGAADVTKVAAETVVKPLAESSAHAIENSATEMASDVGKQTNWTLVILIAVVAAASLIALRIHLIHNRIPHNSVTTKLEKS